LQHPVAAALLTAWPTPPTRAGTVVASRRQLQQQQEQQEQQQLWQKPPADLLEQLADDADDDPFSASRSGPSLHPHQQQPSPQEHAHAHKQHHRQHITHTSGNASWVWSSRLQMELPQPWDTVNLTRIVRCVGLA
jgi:hypothetical protein